MPKLTLAAVLSTAFVGQPVKKTIEVAEQEFDVWVKPSSYEHVVNVLSKTEGKERIARMISTSIVDENGDAIFSYEDVTGEADSERGGLNSEFTVALLAVINEVSLGKPLKASS